MGAIRLMVFGYVESFIRSSVELSHENTSYTVFRTKAEDFVDWRVGGSEFGKALTGGARG
jgi:hypothetical protein